MPPRFFVDLPLLAGTTLALPPGAARHAQVLRLQPGQLVLLFNGHGGQWQAEIRHMGRSEVSVQVGAHQSLDTELLSPVTLAVGMPANDRMDNLVEKATELGVACVQPLVCERSVLRLSGERADKKRLHWQGVAAAASEQSGRSRVPLIAPVCSLADWLQQAAWAPDSQRLVLSLREPRPLATVCGGGATSGRAHLFLSGPEGGLTEAEERAAGQQGFVAVSLGPRVLRADTAPLAALGWLALQPA